MVFRPPLPEKMRGVCIICFAIALVPRCSAHRHRLVSLPGLAPADTVLVAGTGITQAMDSNATATQPHMAIQGSGETKQLERESGPGMSELESQYAAGLGASPDLPDVAETSLGSNLSETSLANETWMSPRSLGSAALGKICEEICSTEDTFRDVVEYLYTFFLSSTGAGAALLQSKSATDSEFKTLAIYFKQIEAIRIVSESLREGMRPIRSRANEGGWTQSEVDVGGPVTSLLQLIEEVTPQFRFWTPYMQNFDAMNTLLDKLRREHKDFEALLKTFQARQPQNLDLMSSIITPIQRLPRYLLLLKALRKDGGLDESYCEAVIDPIINALDKLVSELNSYIGAAAQSQQALLDLQAKYPFANILEPWRKFIGTTPVKIQTSRHQWKDRILTVTSDTIYISGGYYRPLTEVAAMDLFSLSITGDDMLEMKTQDKNWLFKKDDKRHGLSMQELKPMLEKVFGQAYANKPARKYVTGRVQAF